MHRFHPRMGIPALDGDAEPLEGILDGIPIVGPLLSGLFGGGSTPPAGGAGAAGSNPLGNLLGTLGPILGTALGGPLGGALGGLLGGSAGGAGGGAGHAGGLDPSALSALMPLLGSVLQTPGGQQLAAQVATQVVQQMLGLQGSTAAQAATASAATAPVMQELQQLRDAARDDAYRLQATAESRLMQQAQERHRELLSAVQSIPGAVTSAVAPLAAPRRY